MSVWKGNYEYWHVGFLDGHRPHSVYTFEGPTAREHATALCAFLNGGGRESSPAVASVYLERVSP